MDSRMGIMDSEKLFLLKSILKNSFFFIISEIIKALRVPKFRLGIFNFLFWADLDILKTKF
jgi:hypothetical protein